MESSTYLLLDEGKPYSIFTGDTLFLGEVGRPGNFIYLYKFFKKNKIL